MNTQLFTNENHDIARAAAILRGGGLVAFPTETVYGLGANALDEKAVLRIFEAKGRPVDNPLIVHIADVGQVGKLTAEVPETALRLMDAFWPGPLTIVMKKSSLVPAVVSAGLDTVGIRMPKNETALRFLAECAVPVAAPSANRSGSPSPTEFSHVVADMAGRADAIIDAGACTVGVESSVIDLTREVPMLLRPGGITYEALCAVLGKVDKAFDFTEEGAPASPGMKYRHYAPKAPVIVIQGDFQDYVNVHAKEYEKAGVIALEKGAFPSNCVTEILGNSPVEYARNLFSLLRRMDERNVSVILAQDVDCKGMNLATGNRLHKAAGRRVVRWEGEDTLEKRGDGE